MFGATELGTTWTMFHCLHSYIRTAVVNIGQNHLRTRYTRIQHTHMHAHTHTLTHAHTHAHTKIPILRTHIVTLIYFYHGHKLGMLVGYTYTKRRVAYLAYSTCMDMHGPAWTCMDMHGHELVSILNFGKFYYLPNLTTSISSNK